MDLVDCFEILESEAFPCPPWISSGTLEETISAAHRLGYPVVLKFSSSLTSHKTEFNAVRTAIENREQMKSVYLEMTQALRARHVDPKGGRFMVQKQIRPPGVEMIIGTYRDVSFGQEIVVGAGGVLADLARDTATRICPVSFEEAESMVSELKAGRLLKEFRKAAGVNREALVELIRKTSVFAMGNPKIKEMDLNPVLVTVDGVYVVDCRMVVEPLPCDS